MGAIGYNIIGLSLKFFALDNRKCDKSCKDKGVSTVIAIAAVVNSITVGVVWYLT